MQDTLTYAHKVSGRRPAMAFMLLAGCGMLLLGLAYAAPWYFLSPIMLTIAMALFALLLNPQTGCQLTRSSLQFYNRGTKRNVAVASIETVTIRSTMDGGPSALLILANGEKVTIPSLCMNGRLGDALEQLGIPVTRR